MALGWHLWLIWLQHEERDIHLDHRRGGQNHGIFQFYDATVCSCGGFLCLYATGEKGRMGDCPSQL